MRYFGDMVEKIEAKLQTLVRKEKSLPANRAWWINKAMLYLRSNPELRDQIFRFIDVFPVLKRDKDIHIHISEEFAPEKISLPFLLCVLYSTRNLRPIKYFLPQLANMAVRTAAHHFIVSPTKKEILVAIQRLHRLGAKYSLDILGEAVLSEQEAESYKERYMQLMRQLNLMGQEIDVSLKLTSLYSQFHPLANKESKKVIQKRLGDILYYAWSNGGRVTIDAEQYYFRNLTTEIFKELVAGEFAKFRGLSMAHQTYFKDSLDVLLELGRFAKTGNLFFALRLVKGAYWDYEVINARQQNWPIPVYTEKQETDYSFERNLDLALSYYPNIKTAIGTHNLKSIAYAMAKREELGLPKEALEIQLLYGMGNQLIRPVRKLGYPVRVYVGIGDLVEGMSYFARRILENTSQASSAFFTQL